MSGLDNMAGLGSLLLSGVLNLSALTPRAELLMLDFLEAHAEDPLWEGYTRRAVYRFHLPECRARAVALGAPDPGVPVDDTPEQWWPDGVWERARSTPVSELMRMPDTDLLTAAVNLIAAADDGSRTLLAMLQERWLRPTSDRLELGELLDAYAAATAVNG